MTLWGLLVARLVGFTGTVNKCVYSRAEMSVRTQRVAGVLALLESSDGHDPDPAGRLTIHYRLHTVSLIRTLHQCGGGKTSSKYTL